MCRLQVGLLRSVGQFKSSVSFKSAFLSLPVQIAWLTINHLGGSGVKISLFFSASLRFSEPPVFFLGPGKPPASFFFQSASGFCSQFADDN